MKSRSVLLPIALSRILFPNSHPPSRSHLLWSLPAFLVANRAFYELGFLLGEPGALIMNAVVAGELCRIAPIRILFAHHTFVCLLSKAHSPFSFVLQHQMLSELQAIEGLSLLSPSLTILLKQSSTLPVASRVFESN